ncbi:hypothetical protein VBD025_08635 [Virgibacillus flavescens]|uniref:hypothetical protein n=1 Tax=Virgibacillus flavescens TaxID=1611422 RepID=UPI003D35306C
MDKSNETIHEYTEKKMDPYWWIMAFLVLSVGFLLSIALIVVPPILYFAYRSEWLFWLFILIPAGVWMGKKLYITIKKIIWNNNHLSTFTLHKETISTNEWNKYFQTEPEKRTVSLSSILSVVASFYIVRQVSSLRSQGGTGKTKTEIAPIIYVLYKDDKESNIITIPFPVKGQEMDAWLGYFQDINLPLKYTDKVLYRKDMEYLNQKVRLSFLESSDNLIDFSFNGSWQEQSPVLMNDWQEEMQYKEASNSN